MTIEQLVAIFVVIFIFEIIVFFRIHNTVQRGLK